MATDQGQKEKGTEAVQPPAFADRKRNLMTVAMVGGLMILEGVGIVVAAKLSGGGPAESDGATPPTGFTVDADGNLLPEQAELHVSDVVAFNSSDGRVYVYQISVYAVVDTRSREKVEDFFENHRNTIDDRLSRVVRAADYKYFEEADLQTLRRQFKLQLDELLQDESIVKEILFPEFSKSRAD